MDRESQYYYLFKHRIKMSESQEQAYRRKQIKLADEELAHKLMAGTHEFHDRYPENQIAHAKKLYVTGAIELDEFEQRCEEALRC